MKVCRKCNAEKEEKDFNKNKNNIGGYENHCRQCRSLSNKKYRANNLDSVKDNQKKYYRNNIDNVKEKYIEYYYDNKEKAISNGREYKKYKRKTDIVFKLSSSVRRLVYDAFRNKGYKKSSRTAQILGCSYEEFKIYLENKFEPWMTWDNKGLYNSKINYGWDIDHIIPLSTARTEKDILKLNHYTNLQPLCGYINRYVKKDNI